jgi:hypothetical protein
MDEFTWINPVPLAELFALRLPQLHRTRSRRNQRKKGGFDEIDG